MAESNDVFVVGTPVPRFEGSDKVSGRTIYAADVKLPRLLYGKILRSPFPHAFIRRIDSSRARQLRGVRAIIAGQDIPGHLVGKTIRDMPVLCWDRVRFVGDRVAAVAAETAEVAEEALGLIHVEYEELPAVFDPLEAMRAEAPRIHEDVATYEGAPSDQLALDIINGLTRFAWRKGDTDNGFRESDLILEHTFQIPSRHQGYIESHAAIVDVGPDGHMQVWTTTKNPFGTRTQLARAIKVSEARIRVNPVNVGGDFGGKGDALDVTVAYFLARESGQPVKILMTYGEELMAGNPEPPTLVKIKSGVKRNGRIVARTVQAIHSCGAYGGLMANASLAVWHYAGGPYRVDNAFSEFLHVYTNTVPGGYFRSPGSVPAFFALESHTDIVARELGLDPAKFRLMNLIQEGGEDAIGKRLRSVRFTEVLQAALETAGWDGPKPRPGVGRGVALFGRHIGGGETGVILTAELNGTFTLVSPTPDQGSGTHTTLRQVVAQELQVPLDRVQVVIGDTDTAPRDGGARASRVTYVAGRVVLRACGELRERLIDRAARILECSPEEVDFRNGLFSLRNERGQQISLTRVVSHFANPLRVSIEEDAPYPDDMIYLCAQIAEVEVDAETGAVRLERLVTAHDVGTVINPVAHQGQIEGGVVMGLGQALMEELIINDGRVANLSLGDYKIPCALDIPYLETMLVRSGGGVGPYDAKAIGEFANNSAPAAIANAVADAVGVRIFQLPVTAEKIYRALAENSEKAEVRKASPETSHFET